MKAAGCREVSRRIRARVRFQQSKLRILSGPDGDMHRGRDRIDLQGTMDKRPGIRLEIARQFPLQYGVA